MGAKIESLKEKLRVFAGVEGPHLLPDSVAQLVERARGSLKMKEHFGGLTSERGKARATQVMMTFFTLATLGFLSAPKTPENQVAAVVCSGMAVVLNGVGGKIGTRNDTVSKTFLKALQGKIEKMNLGGIGNRMITSISNLLAVTEEERFLYSRPMETIINTILQSLVLLAVAPENLLPLFALVTSLGINILQIGATKKIFGKREELFLNAEEVFLYDPDNPENEKNMLEAAKKKSEGTQPINMLGRMSDALPLFLPLLAGGMSTASNIAGVFGLASYFMNQAKSGSQSFAERIMKMKTAIEYIAEFIAILPKILDVINKVIITNEDFDRHKNESKDEKLIFPEDILEKIKDTSIKDGFIINAKLNLADKGEKLVRGIFSLDKILYLVGGNGTGKTSLLNALFHWNGIHRGETGFIHRDEKGVLHIVNSHDLNLDENRKMFGQWNEGVFKTNGSFQTLSGLSQNEAEKYFLNILQRRNGRLLDFDAGKVLKTFIARPKIFNIEINSSESGPSLGERKFLSIASFLIKAKNNGCKYILIDEPYESMDDKGLGKVLDYLYQDLQDSGVKVILSLQKRVNLPEDVKPEQIVDFNKNYVSHFPVDLNLGFPDTMFLEKLQKGIPKKSNYIKKRLYNDRDNDLFLTDEWTQAMLKNDTKAKEALIFLMLNGNYPNYRLEDEISIGLSKTSKITEIQLYNYLNNIFSSLSKVAKILGMDPLDVISHVTHYDDNLENNISIYVFNNHNTKSLDKSFVNNLKSEVHKLFRGKIKKLPPFEEITEEKVN